MLTQVEGPERARVRPTTIPHPKIIEGYIRSVLTIIEGDPIRGREILSRDVQPFVLTPADDGVYRIMGAFDLATAIRAGETSRAHPGPGRVMTTRWRWAGRRAPAPTRARADPRSRRAIGPLGGRCPSVSRTPSCGA
jgi:hypothetical protein